MTKQTTQNQTPLPKTSRHSVHFPSNTRANPTTQHTTAVTVTPRRSLTSREHGEEENTGGTTHQPTTTHAAQVMRRRPQHNTWRLRVHHIRWLGVVALSVCAVLIVSYLLRLHHQSQSLWWRSASTASSIQLPENAFLASAHPHLVSTARNASTHTATGIIGAMSLVGPCFGSPTATLVC
jgi:cation transport ATPase